MTLTALEVVLGIDNIIFISILSGKLPKAQRTRGRQVGLTLAMLARIAQLNSPASIIGVGVDRRRTRAAHSAWLHLLCHGLLGDG